MRYRNLLLIVLASVLSLGSTARADMSYFDLHGNSSPLAIAGPIQDFQQCNFDFSADPANRAFYQMECRAALMVAAVHTAFYAGQFAFASTGNQYGNPFDLKSLATCFATEAVHNICEHPGYPDAQPLRDYILKTTDAWKYASDLEVRQAVERALQMQITSIASRVWFIRDDKRSEFSSYYELPPVAPGCMQGNLKYAIDVEIAFDSLRNKMIVSKLHNGTRCHR